MEYKYINYDRIINKIANKDKLFFGDYIIDPYQNCEFGCKYCDSSYEKIIFIKNNFLNKVQNEIKDIIKGTIIIGSVVDPYQNIEKKLKMTRNLLNIIKKNQFKVHILTKSTLILRDIDILSQIKNVTVTISIISLNKKISLPYIIENEIEDIVKLSLKYKTKFLLYKFLELKGFQKKCFYDDLKVFNKKLVERYIDLYKDNFTPDSKYIKRINNQILKNCEKYGLSNNV